MCRVQTEIILCKNDDETELKVLTGILLSPASTKLLTIDDKLYRIIHIGDYVEGDTVTRKISVVKNEDRGAYML